MNPQLNKLIKVKPPGSFILKDSQKVEKVKKPVLWSKSMKNIAKDTDPSLKQAISAVNTFKYSSPSPTLIGNFGFSMQ